MHVAEGQGRRRTLQVLFIILGEAVASEDLQLQPYHHEEAAPGDADYLGFLNTLRIRTLVAQAETITPLGDLTDFAELAGK